MNILLINPETKIQGYVPLGLAAIVAYAQKHEFTHEFSIDFLSCQKRSALEIENKLAEKIWDIIGFTAVITHYRYLKTLTASARNLNPQALIIIGGPLANTLPDFLLDHLDIDIAIRGEGEVPFLEILKCVQNGALCVGVAGAVYRNNLGQLISNPQGSVLQMDEMPLLPASDFDIEPYVHHSLGRSVNIQLSRGCPYSCSFCDNSLFPQRIRRRSRENMLEELKQAYSRYNFNFIYLDDLNPFLSRNLIYDFCEVLDELGYNVKWYGNGFAPAMKSDELDYLVRGKCGGLHFGIESGSKDVLVTYNKYIDFAKSERTIKSVIDKGIEAKVNWVIGAPNESLDTIRESIEYFVRIGVSPAIKYLTPLPGTPMYDIAVKQGKIKSLEEYLWDYTDYKSRPLCNISKFTDGELVTIAADAKSEINARVENKPPSW
jgi:radical SAM superfamily enzyme YgiQ (UPF0313 family)